MLIGFALVSHHCEKARTKGVAIVAVLCYNLVRAHEYFFLEMTERAQISIKLMQASYSGRMLSIMLNTYARPVRDLRNNYNEIIDLANEGNQIIITQNGREAAVLIGTHEYREYEKFLHRQYIKHELSQAKESAKKPNTKWLTEEDFWADFEDSL